MPASALPVADPMQTIRTQLRGQVTNIIWANLPELALVPREKAYDRIMGDPHLLYRAFRLLRERPELFAGVVMTRDRRAPESDADQLWCGRTLGEVVALVVRACARRYFKARLNPRNRPLPMPKPGLWARIKVAFGFAPTVKKPVRKAPSAADKLYAALRDFLNFDWQVPLIPTYAALSPQTVANLGPQLLEFREPGQIQALADGQVAASLHEGKVPLLMDKADRLFSTGTDSINAEVLWQVCQKMRMAALFPGLDATEMRKAIAMVAATSPAALKHLLPVLGDDIRKFTLYLFTAYGTFGPVRYRQVLGQNGQVWVVQAMAKRAAKGPPLTGTHEQWKSTIESWLSSAVETVNDAEKGKAQVLDALDKLDEKNPAGKKAEATTAMAPARASAARK